MEFVVVTYPRIRDVFIDGRRVGPTNRVLFVPRGRHLFDLGKPVNYRPPQQSVNVINTSPMTPAFVHFL